MNFTINSRIYGPVHFYTLGCYVYVHAPEQLRWNHKQICLSGSFRGSTVMCGKENDLPSIARSWWRSWLRGQAIFERG